MGADDDASVFPTWTGVGNLGLNAEANYNAELSEIGTIPLTNIYNVDYNGGGALGFSSNYNTSSSWTIFNDSANTEINDAVYFGDQGDTPVYALEFNIATPINSTATRVWEYYKTGDGWTEFTPSFAWKNIPRGTNNYGIGEYCMPLSADYTFPSAAVTLSDTNSLFFAGQYAKIKGDNLPTIIRRISAVTAGAPAATTFTEIIPAGYTVAANSKVCIPSGGQWMPMAPSELFTQTGRTMISWNSWDTPTPAKTDIGNGISAYYVRNRISVFPPASWTTSPINQTTPVSMQGVENISSYPFSVFNSVNEAKFNHLSKGASFDPNETWILRYNDNSTNLPAVNLKTTRWYESQLTSWGTAHRWRSPNDASNTTAYYEKNSAEANWRTLNGGFDWTDYNVTSKIYFGSAKASNIRIGHFLRENPDDYGYALYITPAAASTVMQFYTTAAGAETAITGSYTVPTFNIRTWYCLKTQVTTSGSDNLLKAKLWTPTSPTAACSDNEPAGWVNDKLEVTHTPSAAAAYLYSAGRFGLAADTALARFDDVTVKNSAGTETWFTDNFNDTGCWNVIGSIHGSQGCAYSGTPFSSTYINFTMKHKGGVQSGETGAAAVLGPLNAPEQGDEIYISPVMRGSPIGLDETKKITTDDDHTKNEIWDFVYNSDDNKWDVTGSQYGSDGQIDPNTDYESTDGEIALKIKAGTPAAPKFNSDRAAYFQNSVQRSVGNFTGLNNHNSAIVIQPTWAMTGSTTNYNIEGASGNPIQKGTIDFWFKPNFSGKPDYLQYLFDYASNNNTSRLSVRINPTGKLEFVVWTSSADTLGTIVSTSLIPVAGQWYHFRGAWEDSDAIPDTPLNRAYAWLDGAPFTTNHGNVAIGARAANAGYIRLGNSWQYNAGFDGAMEEFAVFDDAIDTSVACDWGASVGIPVPAAAWIGGAAAVGCTTGGGEARLGNNIFLTHFDTALEPQKGTMFADYFTGHPAMVFMNGADTLTGDRIRVVTVPERTRAWIDNTGSQYTPSARIKYSEGYAITKLSISPSRRFN
jgi:hypothetical protein